MTGLTAEAEESGAARLAGRFPPKGQHSRSWSEKEATPWPLLA